MNIKKVVNFIFEINQLKRQRHSGWFLAGVTQPPSVAEHQLRAAQIGYILAALEGADPEKVACMLLIHDNAEARTGDQNKVSARYFSKKEGEVKAFKDQLEGLGEKIEKKWLEYFEEFEERTTKEGVVAKDADWLETAFQAKEYSDTGYVSAVDWIKNVERAVETKSAKLLLKQMKKTNFHDWWSGLKRMTYRKLQKTR